jgi:His/Glu/Gln/Arg/opine family amino acid ABC transporter permease subunit
MTSEVEKSKRSRALVIPWERVPWWFVIIAILGIFIGYSVLTSEIYLTVISFVMVGVKLTLQTTAFAFILALVFGLLGGLGRVSKNPVLYAIATLYVEIIRGLPMLVIILYAGFVIGPWIRDATGGALDPPMLQRAIIGLGFGYGAYLTEVYRAGIQSIHRGQMEAPAPPGQRPVCPAQRHFADFGHSSGRPVANGPPVRFANLSRLRRVQHRGPAVPDHDHDSFLVEQSAGKEDEN